MQSSADPDLEIKTGGGGVSKKNLFGLKIRGARPPRLAPPLQPVGEKLSSQGVIVVVFSLCCEISLGL